MAFQEQTICYITDASFLLPSLVSATSFRKYIPKDRADIFIFLIGSDNSLIAEANKISEPLGIYIKHMPSAYFDSIDLTKLKKSHVPLATIGRFFLTDMLPEISKNIFYIDGDTWACQDPSALIYADIPSGKFAAAEDTISFRQRISPTAEGDKIRAYLRSLGLNPQKDGYFNNGILAMSRVGWKDISNDAFQYFLDNTTLCQHHDQSALNAIAQGRRLTLSSKWNFQTPYHYLRADKVTTPCIYHFNQAPKAWSAPVRPWMNIYAPYQEAIKPYKSLNLFLKYISDEEAAAHNRNSLKKFRILSVPLILPLMREITGFNRTEKQAWL
ncbi:MAG TPA: hypothetical protein DCM27_08330 [Rhodospirillaceae bacterium]|nr:hypothetical protein [Rhodospirillaceae bacterium]